MQQVQHSKLSSPKEATFSSVTRGCIRVPCTLSPIFPFFFIYSKDQKDCTFGVEYKPPTEALAIGELPKASSGRCEIQSFLKEKIMQIPRVRWC